MSQRDQTGASRITRLAPIALGAGLALVGFSTASAAPFPFLCSTLNTENISNGSANAQGYTNSFGTGTSGVYALPNNVSIAIPENGIICLKSYAAYNSYVLNLLRNSRNTPVTMYIETTFDLGSGSINVAGEAAINAPYRGITSRGGLGGPGGSDGGTCDYSVSTSPRAGDGLGPGGGKASVLKGGGGGASAISAGNAAAGGGAGGVPPSQFEDHHLHGGSGGACGSNSAKTALYGGGGGGGVITIVAGTSLDTGTNTNSQIRAWGGDGGTGGGSGGGGVIRLVSPEVHGSGAMYVRAGLNCQSGSHIGGCGAPGVLKVESLDVTGTFLSTAFSLNGKSAIRFGVPQDINHSTALRPTVDIIQLDAVFDGIPASQTPPAVNYQIHPLERIGTFFESAQVVTATVQTNHVPNTATVYVKMNGVELTPDTASGNLVAVAGNPQGTGTIRTWTANLTIPAGTRIGTFEAWVDDVCTPGATGCAPVQ